MALIALGIFVGRNADALHANFTNFWTPPRFLQSHRICRSLALSLRLAARLDADRSLCRTSGVAVFLRRVE
jgi:hypothetical protein